MAIGKSVTEVPDSEEEPLTSSPEARQDGAVDQLDGAADEPQQDASPRADRSLDGFEFGDAIKVADKQQVVASNAKSSGTVVRAHPQSNTLDQNTNEFIFARENASSLADTSGFSNKQSSAPTDTLSQSSLHKEQDRSTGPTSYDNEKEPRPAIEEGAANGNLETSADTAPKAAGLTESLHLDEDPLPQHGQETSSVYQGREPAETQHRPKVGEECHSSNNTLTRDKARCLSCPPDLIPRDISSSTDKYACARSVATDGISCPSQMKMHDNLRIAETRSILSLAEEVAVQHAQSQKKNFDPTISFIEDPGNLSGNIAPVECPNPSMSNDTARLAFEVEQQVAKGLEEGIPGRLQMDVDGYPRLSQHDKSNSLPDVGDAAYNNEARNQSVAPPATNAPPLKDANTTTRNDVEHPYGSNMPPKLQCGEDRVRVEGELDSSAADKVTCSETSAESQSSMHASSSATSITEELKPTPVKNAQEITLAELKAQRAALIASLVVLPSIRELVSEARASDSTSQASDAEPTDSEVMVAAHKINKKHIKLLHEYNEMKDVGQGLMGLIADQRGVRIVEVQDEFGIDSQD